MRLATTRLRLARALSVAVLALSLAALCPGLRAALLYVAPLLILFCALVADWYPGENLIEALAAWARPRRPASIAPPRPRIASLRPRGGRLLASSLAGRGPPAEPEMTVLFQLPHWRYSMFKRTAICCALGAFLLVPAAAQAHVSLHPNTIPAGAFATLNVRVPGEEENAYAYKVDVLMPSGFTDVDTQNVPGWTTKEITKKLAKPIQTDDGPVSEEVSQVIWTGDRSVDGRLDNGTFIQFPLSVAIPGNLTGKSLAFKTLETYSNGKVARWIGSPSAEFPAPTINITAKEGVLEDIAGGEAGPTPGEVPGAPSTSSSSGASKGLAIAALVVGALGLLAGGAALVSVRRRPATGSSGGASAK